MARSQLEKLNHLPEMRIVLVGGKKTGKSSCGNTILGRECFDTDTQTTSCTEKQGNINGKLITVQDTPGGFLVTSEILMEPLSCAIFLVVNASSSFKMAHREELEKQLEAGGGHMWSRAVVLFSYGDWLGDTIIEQRIESEGEPLQGLVEKCGNRYHVLDNKHLTNGAQVDELIALMEEMLVEERLSALHRGDHMWKSVSAAHEEERDTMTQCTQDLNVSCDLTESDISATQTTQSCSNATPPGGQIVALPAGRAGRHNILGRHRFMSILASLLACKKGLSWTGARQQRLIANMPIYISAGDPHNNQRLDCERQVCLFSPACPTMLVLLPQTQNRALTEGNATLVHSLCHPLLRERTLRRLTESGGLQQLIDQWGDSSLEELEAFIDAYFEMVWEQTMGSSQLTESDSGATEQDTVVREAGQEEVLSSIDRKLSKLELLEEIRTDLSKLKESLEHSWKAIQELTHKSKEETNNSC